MTEEVPPTRNARPRVLLWGAVGGCLLAVVLACGFPWYWGAKAEGFAKSAKAATLRQDWKSLKNISESWLAWDPGSDDGRLYLAESCVQTNQFKQAVEALAGIRPDFHGFLQAQGALAEILFSDLNRPVEAVAVWKRMLELEPSASGPHQRLIYWYAMTLQRYKLIEQILAAAEANAEPPEAYPYLILANDLNFSDGLAMVTRWRTEYPDDRMLEIAQAVYAAKNSYTRSLPKFGSSTVMPGDQSLVKKCLKKYPGQLEPLALAIDQALFDGDATRVAELLKLASPEAAKDSRFWRFRGWLFMSNKAFAKAEESLRVGLEFHPGDWKLRLLLADALRQQNHLAEAECEAKLAAQGKVLRTKIMESPNAREIDNDLIREIYAYFKQTGPKAIFEALSRRIND